MSGDISYQDLEDLRKEYESARNDYGRLLILIGRYRIDTGRDVPNSFQKARDIIKTYIDKCHQSLYDKQEALDLRSKGLKEKLREHRIYQAQCGEFFDRALGELPKRSKFMMCQFYKLCTDFKEQMKTRAAYLKDGNLRILLMGEVNAGKSSVMNLLMGGAYLPIDHGPCTKTPCEITHSQDKKAYLYFKNEYGIDPLCLDLDYDENSTTWLRVREGIINGKDTGEGFKLLEKIVICWPLVILACQETMHLTGETVNRDKIDEKSLPKVTFVDVPGIFDKDETFHTLYPFIRRADAYLFVLNNSDLIGLADDRVLRLMRIIQSLSEEEQGSFHPKFSLFVCNFWDRVEIHRRDKLLTTTLVELKKVWPALKSKQLIPCIASVEALHAIKARSINDEYEGFYHKACRFLETAIKSQIEMNSWWLASFLDRSMVILSNASNIKYFARTKIEEVKRQIIEYHKEIIQFDQSRKNTEHDISVETEIFKDKIKQEIRKSLQENKTKLVKWDSDSVRDLRLDDTWPKTYDAISTRIVERLERHIIDDPNVCQIKVDFDNFLKDRLSNLMSRYHHLEKKMPLIVDITSGLDTKMNGLNMAIQENSDIFPFIASGLALLFLPLTPIILLLWKIYEEVNSPKYLTDQSEFTMDKVSFIEKQTENFIDNIIKNRLISVTEAAIQDAPRNAKCMMQILHSCSERYMESARCLMDEVTSGTNEQESSNDIEIISEQLKLFVINKVIESDVDENSLIVDTKDPLKLIGEGSFSTVHQAQLLTDDNTLEVAVKQVKWPIGEGNAPDNSFIIRELLTLQMLSHKPHEERMNFIDYYGFIMMTTEQTFNLQLVTDLYDYNLAELIDEDKLVLPSPANYRRVCHFPANAKDEEYVTSSNYFLNIATQVTKGVQFLHRYNIVHRDIKPSNFLIRLTDESITVHLADFGMSQKTNLIRTFGPNVGTDLYSSPEVRKGGLNTQASDVYSTVLVIWELWYGSVVYSDLSRAALAFPNRSPPKMKKTFPPNPLKTLLTQCWKEEPRQRPNINTFVKCLGEMLVLEK